MSLAGGALLISYDSLPDQHVDVLDDPAHTEALRVLGQQESLAVMRHQEAKPYAKPCVRPPGTPPIEDWFALYETFCALSVTDRVRLLDVARSLKSDQETMISIGMHDAIVEADAVVGACQGKHPRSKWRSYTIEQHIGKIIRHAGAALYGERIDPETKRRALGHVMARAAMALQLDIEDSRRR